MADLQIVVDTKSAEAALAKVGPDELARRSRAAMQESLARAQADVQGATPVFLNVLRGGTFSEIHGSGVSLHGKVAPPLAARDYAAVVEEGRRPGKMPPVSAIAAWVGRKLGVGVSPFLVARAIARKGTKGRHMFRDAHKRAQGYVPDIFAKHFRI